MQVEELLEASARRDPQKIALVCGAARYTYQELDQQANRLAHSFQSAGIRRGDRVAVYLDNSPEAVVAIFAALKAGAVFLPINPTTKADKLNYILNNCRAAGLVMPSAKYPGLGQALESVPSLKAIWVVGSPVGIRTPAAFDLISLGSILCDEALPAHPPPKTCIDIDLAALIYTSGSTGQPKGVMLTHLNVLSATTSITTYLGNVRSDRILNVLPLSFGYGLCQVLTAFQVGASVVLERSFAYPDAVLETMCRERITGLPIVPTISAVLLQLDLSPDRFPDLRYITNAAAALPTDHIRRLREIFPAVRIFSMYGLTECTRVTYLPPEQLDNRSNSVGRGMPNEEVYVVGEDGERVPPRIVGELVVRGSHVMRGYWELPEETDRVLKPGPLPGERLLYTGDLFWTDEEGYLYFFSRKDDIIKSRGEKVSPREVEEVLYTLPGVAEAAVIGVPDPILGEAVQAYLTVTDDAALSEQDVLRHCAGRLENFMVPQSVVFVKAMPKTGNGKISRKQLRENIGVPQ